MRILCIIIPLLCAYLLLYYLENKCEALGGLRLKATFGLYHCYDKDSLREIEEEEEKKI